jgi:uncharacterized protein YbjT (DUF2867 family)
VADSYRRIIDRVREANPDARIFGVTATPNRGDKKGLREVFDNVADQVRLGELIASGHLVPPRTFVIDVGVQDELRSVRKTMSDFDMAEVAGIMDRAPVTDEVIRHWKEKAGDRQTVVFCSTVAHAEHVTEAFRTAAELAGVDRMVYLGGLGPEEHEDLSEHLASRHEVGRVLADGPTAVIELRAAVVIGSGSASFEMLRHLVEVLPVMVTPRWVENRCQPIAVRDVLGYLCAVLDIETDGHTVLEIGGPDVLTYREMMRVFAETSGLRRRIIQTVPVLTPKLSSHWVGLVTPLPAGLAKPLVASLINEVVADTTRVDELIPRDCLPFGEAVRLALRRVHDLEVPSSWADAELGRPDIVARREAASRKDARSALGDGAGDRQAEPQAHDPEWAGGTLLSDERAAISDAPVADLFAEVCSIGGDRGWPVADLLWEVRGLLDTVLGGIGTRRGRRHPRSLAVGDTLDFWRVEVLEHNQLLRLRAEMKVPGEAWLEFRTSELEDGRSLLEQRARFVPRGLWGRVYWLAMMPFHAVIFPIMARRLAQQAAAPRPRVRHD